jgi:hypothetical protein
MKNTIRCKFQCSSVEHHAWGGRTMKASVVYAGDRNVEDNTFAKATPTGSISLQIDNPAAREIIHEGDYFYADLIVIPSVGPQPMTRFDEMEYEAGRQLAREGHQLPDYASPWAQEGYSTGLEERQKIANRQDTPPVDNAHVAQGCEKFSPSHETSIAAEWQHSSQSLPTQK